jgi:membrane protease YdiL (CAAX protease family)
VQLRVHPRLRDFLEVALGYGLVLAVIWTPMPTQRLLYWLAVICIVGLTVLQRDTWRSLGLAPTGAWRATWIVVGAFALAAVAVVIAKLLGTFHPLPRSGNFPLNFRMGGYLVWSFLQEFMLQIYVLTRLLRLLPRRSVAIATAALLFAVAHIPNPVLVVLTLVWGLIACSLFLRYRNLYALGLAHAILGLCVATTVPDALHHHMRVGLGYLRYHPRHHRIQRSNAPQTVSTQAWVMEDAATLLSDRHARP